MTTFSDYLIRQRACENARVWVGNKTAEQAWRECRRVDWMLWLLWRLSPNDRRPRLAAADFAERAWSHIDDEPGKLSAAWAIGAARRGDPEEMAAAHSAAYASAAAASSAADAAAAAAAYVDANAAAAAASAASSYAATDAATDAAERAAQANILRKYFPAAEIARLVREASK